jgi:lysine 2,3-aminomutase
MKKVHELDKIAINVKSRRLLLKLLKENPKLDEIMRNSKNETEALIGVRDWVLTELKKSPDAYRFYTQKTNDRESFESLEWKNYASIRILDYIDHAGIEYVDLNLRGEMAVSNPMKLIWLGINRGTGGAKPGFYEDMIHLFRQFSGTDEHRIPDPGTVEKWMERYPSGMDPRIIELRRENKERILKLIISKINSEEIKDKKYFFEAGLSDDQKMKLAQEWWKESLFHLRFAARTPEALNEMLGFSLDPDTMKILYEAREAGIPFFINPYYVSLLHVRVPYFAVGADLGIRDYVIYSKRLVEEFGHIVAWEKEDLVEPGKPNAAGWLLPSHHNVHRRYPEVAILIPDTMGRACGGLCASCQRMYDFQRGNLNFNLDKLRPKEDWPTKLKRLLDYFEKDVQLRDILITGGDALMSSDKSLKHLLDEICEMASRKKARNEKLPEGEKHAEIIRIRLGTRLPVYLPQRITPEMTEILRDFREKAVSLGMKQFIIQTHYESPMEITPESKLAIDRLISAGWIITNQHVMTTASSRRGHTAKLRKALNDVGVLTYYTFTVKGYMENNHNFATNGRAVQEQIEEKIIGQINPSQYEQIKQFPEEPELMVENIDALRKFSNIPFLATDRNVLNLPGVGKSLTFRVIGITRYGRRILEFDHDNTRSHSPIINKMGKMIIIESKSIREYLNQLDEMGENIEEYQNIFGYSLGQTEPRIPIYEYPEYEFQLSAEMSNLEI